MAQGKRRWLCPRCRAPCPGCACDLLPQPDTWPRVQKGVKLFPAPLVGDTVERGTPWRVAARAGPGAYPKANGRRTVTRLGSAVLLCSGCSSHGDTGHEATRVGDRSRRASARPWVPQERFWHPQPHTMPYWHRAGKETRLVSVYFTAIGFVQICIYMGTYKSLCRGTEAPEHPSPPRPFPSLGTTQELKCIMAREQGEHSGFPREAPAIPSFGAVGSAQRGPGSPGSTPGPP